MIQWRPVVGYEGLYEVSDTGLVRSCERVMPCSNGKKRKCAPKILSQSLSNSGYPTVCLCKSGDQKSKLVHREVARSFIPGVGDVVRHIDGDKKNSAVGNLCWGSHEQNANDKRAHGKHLEGVRHPRSSITGDDVRRIRALTGEGVSQLEICRRLNLGRGVVGPIARGDSWRSVK